MTDFLLELRSEEIPARMQSKARDDLAKAFAAEMAKAGLVADAITTYATPRRLALIATGLPLETVAVREETKGPKVGAPPQAMEGFLRKTGLRADQLVERDGVHFAVVEKPGRATVDVLGEAIPVIINAFPWPKSMRWGTASQTTESLRWVRPLHGIVALFGNEVVPFSIDGIDSGSATIGHRFMGQPKNPVRPEPVEGLPFSKDEKQDSASTSSARTVLIKNAASYVDDLRAAHVIVDQDERASLIRDGAIALASEHGLSWIADEALVAENAGLTEWPVPLLGDFDPAFLEVPPEVIRLTLATNQKYFVCESPLPLAGGAGGGLVTDDSGPAPTPNPSRKREGDLAPAFICTANISAKDGGLSVVVGNRKVLAARLSDARFFWEQDKKTSLADHAAKLSRITFHEKLGTVADKVDRVAKLARWLVEEGIVKPSPLQGRGLGEGASKGSSASERPLSPALSPEGERELLATLAEQAARLCKADLVTEMVGEFPELQGIMGGYYARAEGLPDAVADAIRDHYKPVGQSDDVPTAPVTVAVSLADKLDTLVGFYFEKMPPTGSKDPFALRRAALGVISIIQANNLRLPLEHILTGTLWILTFEDFDVASLNERIAKLNAFDPSQETEWGKKAVLGEVAAMQGEALVNADKARRFSPARSQLLDFFADRLKAQQREAGVRHDLIDAVFALGGEDDLVRLLARVHALQAFVETPDGTNLLSAYKRAGNILKQSSSPLVGEDQGGGRDASASHKTLLAADAADSPHPNPSPQGGGALEDTALLAALTAAEPLATAAIEAEDFAAAMTALASLRAPIDAFFDGVMVNDPDAAKRAFRLGLLARFVGAVHKVADFSKIEG